MEITLQKTDSPMLFESKLSELGASRERVFFVGRGLEMIHERVT